MPVFVASLSFAAFQILILVALVRVLGADQYSTYSLSMAIAISLSALLTEWVRLLVARFSGVRGDRLRASILRTALIWTVGSGVVSLLSSVLVAAAVASLEHVELALSIVAVGVLTSSSIMGDAVATFIRFNCQSRDFILYSIARILISGVAILGVAEMTGSGTYSAMSFGLAVNAVAVVAIARYWLPIRGTFSPRRLLRFLPIGWAMAMGAITSNATFSLARLVLKPIMPGEVAGAFFLALDLATRGLNVLGTAFNTWSAPGLYEASHQRSEDAVFKAAARTSALFSAIWVSLGVLGCVIAAVTPVILTGRQAYGSYEIVIVANILGVLLLTGRLFNLDMLMNAIGRYRVVAIASITTVAITAAAGVLPGLAAWALPCGVVASLVITAVAGMRVRTIRNALGGMVIVGAFGFAALEWAVRIAAELSLDRVARGAALAAAMILLSLLLALPWLKARRAR